MECEILCSAVSLLQSHAFTFTPLRNNNSASEYTLFSFFFVITDENSLISDKLLLSVSLLTVDVVESNISLEPRGHTHVRPESALVILDRKI